MQQNKVKKKLVCFLSITFAISLIAYIPIISNGSLETGNGIYVFFLMWAPGIAGLTTQLIFERSLKGMGWKLGKVRYLALAYILPLLYCLVVYGLTWSTGLGGVPSAGFIENLSTMYPAIPTSTALLLQLAGMGSLGVIASMFSALGEEIGWRGLMVPEMSKIMPFTKVSIISGVIWAVWHLPLILFADYNLPGMPQWYAVLMFLIMVIGISFAFAWSRLKSGSLWTAALLHASHNMFVQGIFTPLTEQNPKTPFIIDEFGCGLAIMGVILAGFFWWKRKNLPKLNQGMV